MLQQPTYGGDNTECYSSQRMGEITRNVTATYVGEREHGMLQQPTYGGDNTEYYSNIRMGEKTRNVTAANVWER